MKKVMECSQAVAEAVKLVKPAVIPMYPITPQTHIVETLAKQINNGILDSEMIHVESEHSALSAAIGASAIGVRVFTATASQGLALMNEILHIASGMRMPIVMAVANRALSAPINIWNDHQDSISARDTSWLQFYVESSQEALDTVIMAYKIAENHKVLLPIMVCLDGFTLSHVYEPVDIPDKKQVKRFLPDYKPLFKLDPAKPITIGPIAFPNSFMEIKKQQQDAMENSVKIIKDVCGDFKKIFKRSYGDGFIETYKINDAKHAVIAMGSVCGTIRFVVDELRKKGKKVGLIKIKCFRPFPAEKIKKACERLKIVSVIDRDVSYGNQGALFTEVKAVLDKKTVNSFIAGLGGRDIKIEHIKKIFGNTKQKWLF